MAVEAAPVFDTGLKSVEDAMGLPSPIFVERPRMLRVEVNGLLHDWFDVDELGDMVKAPGFSTTLRENIARYFGVPVKCQAVYDEDGLLATAADFSRALHRYAPKLYVYNLEEMGAQLREKTSEQLAKIDAEVELTRRHFNPRNAVAKAPKLAGSLIQEPVSGISPQQLKETFVIKATDVQTSEAVRHKEGDFSEPSPRLLPILRVEAAVPANSSLDPHAQERDVSPTRQTTPCGVQVLSQLNGASVASTVPEVKTLQCAKVLRGPELFPEATKVEANSAPLGRAAVEMETLRIGDATINLTPGRHSVTLTKDLQQRSPLGPCVYPSACLQQRSPTGQPLAATPRQDCSVLITPDSLQHTAPQGSGSLTYESGFKSPPTRTPSAPRLSVAHLRGLACARTPSAPACRAQPCHRSPPQPLQGQVPLHGYSPQPLPQQASAQPRPSPNGCGVPAGGGDARPPSFAWQQPAGLVAHGNAYLTAVPNGQVRVVSPSPQKQGVQGMQGVQGLHVPQRFVQRPTSRPRMQQDYASSMSGRSLSARRLPQ